MLMHVPIVQLSSEVVAKDDQLDAPKEGVTRELKTEGKCFSEEYFEDEVVEKKHPQDG